MNVKLFCEENKKNMINLSSAEFALRVVQIKNYTPCYFCLLVPLRIFVMNSRWAPTRVKGFMSYAGNECPKRAAHQFDQGFSIHQNLLQYPVIQ